MKYAIIILSMCSCISMHSQVQLERSVLSSAGVDSESNTYRHQGSLAQDFAGIANSPVIIASHGFWNSVLQRSTSVVWLDESPLDIFTIDEVFPNPSRDVFSFRVQSQKFLDVSIIVGSMDGKVVKAENRQTLQRGIGQIDIDLTGFPPGRYNLTLQAEGRNITRSVTLID